MLIRNKWALEGLTSCGEILNLLYMYVSMSTNLMVINIYLLIMYTNAHKYKDSIMRVTFMGT